MTGLSSETLLNALEACEMHKTMAVHFRPYGAFDISIDQDNWARRFQRRDRQAEKVRKALLAKAAAQEARVRELDRQAVLDSARVEAARALLMVTEPVREGEITFCTVCGGTDTYSKFGDVSHRTDCEWLALKSALDAQEEV